VEVNDDIEIASGLVEAGVTVWVDGGWGVDICMSDAGYDEGWRLGDICAENRGWDDYNGVHGRE